MDVTSPDLQSFLARFGLKRFRPGQREVIDAINAGRDCLCIMPTGGGKSLCFQLPAIARPGMVIVVSPLIALMKDQVDALQSHDVAATLINSSLSVSEQHDRIRRMTDGEFDLVYVAPERMRSRHFVEALSSVQIQLLAVDEAHCISQWGHDFRPDYARLGNMRKQMGSPQTIALTATATQTVRADICDVLELHQPAVFVSGFARENLSLAAVSASTNSDKDRELVEFLDRHSGCGIVYSATRKGCEHIVELLSDRLTRSIDYYHAGLEPDQRKRIQTAFSRGETEIIVATNAFGMGIDKSDLRFVVHYNLPGSIEAYYQEAGRAGRDGQPANCLLLHSFQDRFLQEFFIENSYPSREIVQRVYQFLCSREEDPIEMTLHDIQQTLGLSIGNEGIRVCETLLEKSGALERMDTQQNLASVKIDHSSPVLVDLLPREAKVQRSVLGALGDIVGGLREQRVYFDARKLTTALSMKWESVLRALRELNKLEWFDYVSPFRGRAIHLLRREPFQNLGIDFAELEKRKRAEYERLENVIGLANTRRCRQFEILEYFGDPGSADCGHCDNCHGGDVAAASTAVDMSKSQGCLFAVQVVLSGTARTHGRIGKTLLAQMLCGSEAKKIKQLNLHRLSTFGMLGALSQAETAELIDALIASQLIKQTELLKFRPIVEITQRGHAVMTGRGPFDFLHRIPARLARKLNFEFANSQPAGMQQPKAASDSASRTPPVQTSDAFTEAPDECVEPAADEPSDQFSDERSHRADSQHVLAVRPNHYWTCLLIEKGFSVDEVCQIRRLSKEVVEAHLQIAEESPVSE